MKSFSGLVRRGVMAALAATLSAACAATGAGPIDFGKAEFRATGTHLKPAIMRVKGMPREGFKIARIGNVVMVRASDDRGAMYGLLDAAEQIRLTGNIQTKTAKPFLRVRNFKFNLPLSGSAYLSDEDLKNNAWFYDLAYWRAFMSMMARNRYNAVSFWSAHPYAHMVRLTKYPEACTLTDSQLAKNKAFFHKLFRMAREHGLDVNLVTWNIHVSEGFKKAHNVKDGQDSPLIRDYTKECVKELLKEYPEITGIGTCPGEAMPGSADDRENWIKEVYLDTQKKNPKPFILRYWGGEPTATAKMLQKAGYKAPVLLDIKFNGEHMYSSTKPHVLDKRWENLQPRPYEMLWHLRNDDIFQLRWGDPEFARAVVLNCGKPGSAGFVMGSEIEIPGEDRNHTAATVKHKTWKYEFEKNWMRFAVWGRLGYDPNEPESLWIHQFEARFGRKAGKDAYLALKHASKIIPLVTSFHWNYMNGDWYPEGNVGAWNTSYEKPMTNFRQGAMWHGILEWMFNQTIDDSLQSIPDYVADKLAGRKTPTGVKTPDDVANELGRLSDLSMKHLGRAFDRGSARGEAECMREDLEAESLLGQFYAWKIREAERILEEISRPTYTNLAEGSIWSVTGYWKDLAKVADGHYKQHEVWLMGQFSWGKYTKEAEREAVFAAKLEAWPRIEQTWRWNGKPQTFTVGYDAAEWCKKNSKNAAAAQVLEQWIRHFEKRAFTTPKVPAFMAAMGAPMATTTFNATKAGAGLVEITGKDIGSVSWNGRHIPVRPGAAIAFVGTCGAGENTLQVHFSKSPTVVPVARFDFTPDAQVFEAEAGDLTAPFQAIDFLGASGRAIAIPIGAGRGEDNGKVLDRGAAVYTVKIPEDGRFVLRARAWWKNTSNNSLFWSWDDGKPEVLGNDEEYGRWHWVSTKAVRLTAGVHRLVIRNRDENSVVDCFVVAK